MIHSMVTNAASEKFLPYLEEIKSAILVIRCDFAMRINLRSMGQKSAAAIVGPR